MIREWIGRLLVPQMDMAACGPLVGVIDWIEDPDSDDDESSAKGFNEPTNFEPGDESDDEEE